MDSLMQIVLVLISLVALLSFIAVMRKSGSSKDDHVEENHAVEEPEEPGFWETLEDSDGDVQLYRKEIPGGWLYIHDPPGSDTVMCFVPFPPKHEVTK